MMRNRHTALCLILVFMGFYNVPSTSKAQSFSLATNNVAFNFTTLGLNPAYINAVTIQSLNTVSAPGMFFANYRTNFTVANCGTISNGYVICSQLVYGLGVTYQIQLSDGFVLTTTNFCIPSNASFDVNGNTPANQWVGGGLSPNFSWSTPYLTNIMVGGGSSSTNTFTSTNGTITISSSPTGLGSNTDLSVSSLVVTNMGTGYSLLSPDLSTPVATNSLTMIYNSLFANYGKTFIWNVGDGYLDLVDYNGNQVLGLGYVNSGQRTSFFSPLYPLYANGAGVSNVLSAAIATNAANGGNILVTNATTAANLNGVNLTNGAVNAPGGFVGPFNAAQLTGQQPLGTVNPAVVLSSGRAYTTNIVVNLNTNEYDWADSYGTMYWNPTIGCYTNSVGKVMGFTLSDQSWETGPTPFSSVNSGSADRTLGLPPNAGYAIIFTNTALNWADNLGDDLFDFTGWFPTNSIITNIATYYAVNLTSVDLNGGPITNGAYYGSGTISNAASWSGGNALLTNVVLDAGGQIWTAMTKPSWLVWFSPLASVANTNYPVEDDNMMAASILALRTNGILSLLTNIPGWNPWINIDNATFRTRCTGASTNWFFRDRNFGTMDWDKRIYTHGSPAWLCNFARTNGFKILVQINTSPMHIPPGYDAILQNPNGGQSVFYNNTNQIFYQGNIPFTLISDPENLETDEAELMAFGFDGMICAEGYSLTNISDYVMLEKLAHDGALNIPIPNGANVGWPYNGYLNISGSGFNANGGYLQWPTLYEMGKQFFVAHYESALGALTQNSMGAELRPLRTAGIYDNNGQVGDGNGGQVSSAGGNGLAAMLRDYAGVQKANQGGYVIWQGWGDTNSLCAVALYHCPLQESFNNPMVGSNSISTLSNAFVNPGWVRVWTDQDQNMPTIVTNYAGKGYVAITRLSDGSRAVGCFETNSASQAMTVTWPELGYDTNSYCAVSDTIGGIATSTNQASYSITMPGGSANLLLFKQVTIATNIIATSYLCVSNVWSLSGATSGAPNFSTIFHVSSNGIPTDIYMSNGVPFFYNEQSPSSGIIP